MSVLKSSKSGEDISTKEALYRAILAAPRDDIPRRVFADHCYEIGEPQRGEFILTQIELDRARKAGWQADHEAGVLTSSDPISEHGNRLAELSRRANELLRLPAEKSGADGTNSTHWAGSACRLLTGPHRESGNGVIFDRGLVGNVTASLRSWMGGPCNCLFESSRRSCNWYHRGVPWINGLGPQLVARHPIEELRLSGFYFSAYNSYRPAGLYRYTQETSTENLARGQWWAIPACLELPWVRHSSGVMVAFASDDEGRTAVASAALSWARQMAQNPDLFFEQVRERAALYGIRF